MEEDLKCHFQGLDIPEKLLALLKFSNEIAQNKYFSNGFEFSLDKEKVGLKTYSDNKEFLCSIYEFAVADGTGSSYGFWLKDGSSDLDRAPIVAFGSEGGFHIVANNFAGLLQILTFDSEPMIDWDEICYYKDTKDFEPSAKSKEYRDWLRKECALAGIESADEIVQEAQKTHKESFSAWVGNFYKN